MPSDAEPANEAAREPEDGQLVAAAKQAAKEQIRRGVERLLERRGWSEIGLEARVGKQASTVRNILKGNTDPQLSTLLRLVKAFDLSSIEELLGSMPPPAPSRQLVDGLLRDHPAG